MACSARGLKGQHWMAYWHMGIWAGNKILSRHHGTEILEEQLCNRALRGGSAIEALGANTAIDALRDIYNHMGAVMIAQDLN